MAVELKPDFYQALYNRSVLLQEEGKIDEATEDILKVLEIKSDSVKAHFFYGFISYENKEFEKALTSFNKTIEIDPKYSQAYQYRARIFNRLGENEKAQADLAILKTLKD